MSLTTIRIKIALSPQCGRGILVLADACAGHSACYTVASELIVYSTATARGMWAAGIMRAVVWNLFLATCVWLFLCAYRGFS